jgi:hypothetical protein
VMKLELENLPLDSSHMMTSSLVTESDVSERRVIYAPKLAV